MDLLLERYHATRDICLGRIYGPSMERLFYTLEPGWNNNARNKSCIPFGEYKVEPWLSKKFGRCLKVLNVPGREAILIHAGNYREDTKGCILIGTTALDEAVYNSRAAMRQILKLQTSAFNLTVKAAIPLPVFDH